MRDIPIEVMLSWPTANYVNPETRGNALLIVNIVLMSLVTFVVFLRLYVRIFLLRWFGIDDLFIIIALITTAGFTACVILANIHYGWNHHIWDLPFDKIPAALQIGWATKMLFAAASCFTRQSLLLFYYRLVRDGNMIMFRRAIHIASVISVTTMLLLILLTTFQCTPIRAFWTWPSMPNSRCLDDGKLTFGLGLTNTFADLLVTIIPIPLISRLELPRRRRIGAILLVSLGFIVCAAGGAKAYYIWQSLIASYDQTWYSYGMFMSAAVEIDLGVICACAPALRLVLVKIAKPFISGISKNLSHMSPFSSDKAMTSLSQLTASRPTTKSGVLELIAKGPGVSIMGPDSTSADESLYLAEKGFIVTRGSSAMSNRGNSRSGTPCPPYLWDEPWTGDNAPKTIVEEDPDVIEIDTIITSATSRTATRCSITTQRANTISVSTTTTTSSRGRSTGGFGPAIAEQEGVGILPDVTSSKNSTQQPDDDIDEDDELELPIQGIPISEERPQTRATVAFISNRLSWLKFDLESPTEERPKTSDAALGRKRLSWLDDRSREDMYAERRESLGRHDSATISQEFVGRERERDQQSPCRTLDMEKRGEELGWDLERIRSEMRDSW